MITQLSRKHIIFIKASITTAHSEIHALPGDACPVTLHKHDSEFASESYHAKDRNAQCLTFRCASSEDPLEMAYIKTITKQLRTALSKVLTPLSCRDQYICAPTYVLCALPRFSCLSGFNSYAWKMARAVHTFRRPSLERAPNFAR